MESVSHNIQNFCGQLNMIFRVENANRIKALINIIENFFDQLQSKVTIITKLVSKRPNNTVENSLEVRLMQAIQQIEIKLDEGFQKSKEISSNFWERIEIGGDKGQGRVKDHGEQFGEEIRVDDGTEFLKDEGEQHDKLLFLGLRRTVFEVLKQGAQGKDEPLENEIGLLLVEVITALEVVDVNSDDLFLDRSHILHCQEVQYVLSTVFEHQVHFARVKHIKFTQGFLDLLQHCPVMLSCSYRQILVYLQKIQNPLFAFLVFKNIRVALG